MPNTTYTVTVKEMDNEYNHTDREPKIIATFSSKQKIDVRRKITEYMKNYALKRHAGRIVNYSLKLELSTNF